MQLADEIRTCGDFIFVPLCGLEIYLNEPDNTAEPDLLTDIGLPVIKAG